MLVGGRGGRDAVEAGRRSDPEPPEQVGAIAADLGGLTHPGGATLVFDDLDGVEAGQDVSPE